MYPHKPIVVVNHWLCLGGGKDTAERGGQLVLFLPPELEPKRKSRRRITLSLPSLCPKLSGNTLEVVTFFPAITRYTSFSPLLLCGGGGARGGGERGKGGRNGFSRRRSPLPLPFLPPPLPLRRWRRSLRSGVICLLTLLLNGKPPSERPFGKDKHCRRLFRSFRDFLT